jgi:hypothetical protein
MTSLPAHYLVALYAIIPVCLSIITIDSLFFDHQIRSLLPYSPELVSWFTVFFVLPHVVASSLLLADSDYLAYYRKQIIFAVLGALLLSVVAPLVIGIYLSTIFFVTWTILHVIGQQLGIARIFCSSIGLSFYIWKYLLSIQSVLLYLSLMNVGADLLHRCIGYLFPVVLIIGVMLTTILSKTATSNEGRYYLWATFLLVLACSACFLTGDWFFVLLMPRVVHDLTAFAFYIVHDTNRKRTKLSNWFHRMWPVSLLPSIIAIPLLAILIAWLVKDLDPLTTTVGFSLIIFVSYFHYLTEAFTWKGPTPHRKLVPVSVR